MTILAKALVIAVAVWFFTTAQQHKKSPIEWAMIGIVGYGLGWGITYGVLHVLSVPMSFFIMQIPALVGACVAYLVRGKLLTDATKSA